MTKKEYERLQALMKQPEIAARLAKYSNDYFGARESAMKQALAKDCQHHDALRAAFLWGVQSAFEYQKQPPPGLTRYARSLRDQVKKMPKPGLKPCWYCLRKISRGRRHDKACPFSRVKA